ncbi:protein kinase [Nonomuraea sp. NBC_01738]|uniref:protein kinase domain-containing protein n=1 Tax=Nonomuraea sp. NBC_01738 TaxID=2976003 RepID=UPI002E147389|nr:protein kinase [Nonomuraea sp. NBC_01738]
MQPLMPADPRQISVFRLSHVLGRGGQGSVYLGEDPAGIKVAVKVLHPQGPLDPDAHRRFMREAEAARQVAPFCTARVLDVGFVDERPFTVSEFIPGPSLDLLIKVEGPRSGSGLDRLAVATLTALAAIHRAGIVHRDFKPGNVIMGPEGPAVIDFGIARSLDHTATSSVMGTPAFMAPEQFGGGAIGAAVDLFSWASTMVYAATGHQAFKGETMPALMHSILVAEADLSGVPGTLRGLLERCLSKEARGRPTAEQAVGMLTHQTDGPARTLLLSEGGGSGTRVLDPGFFPTGTGEPDAASPAMEAAGSSEGGVHAAGGGMPPHNRAPEAGLLPDGRVSGDMSHLDGRRSGAESRLEDRVPESGPSAPGRASEGISRPGGQMSEAGSHLEGRAPEGEPPSGGRSGEAGAPLADRAPGTGSPATGGAAGVGSSLAGRTAEAGALPDAHPSEPGPPPSPGQAPEIGSSQDEGASGAGSPRNDRAAMFQPQLSGQAEAGPPSSDGPHGSRSHSDAGAAISANNDVGPGHAGAQLGAEPGGATPGDAPGHAAEPAEHTRASASSGAPSVETRPPGATGPAGPSGNLAPHAGDERDSAARDPATTKARRDVSEGDRPPTGSRQHGAAALDADKPPAGSQQHKAPDGAQPTPTASQDRMPVAGHHAPAGPQAGTEQGRDPQGRSASGGHRPAAGGPQPGSVPGRDTRPTAAQWHGAAPGGDTLAIGAPPVNTAMPGVHAGHGGAVPYGGALGGRPPQGLYGGPPYGGGFQRQGMPGTGQPGASGTFALVFAIITMLVGGLFSLLLMIQGVDLLAVWIDGGHGGIVSPFVWNAVTVGGMIFVIPVYGVALWRHNVIAAIGLLMLVPLGLIHLFWAFAMGAPSGFPGILVALIPAITQGAVIAGASLLAWRVGWVPAVAGVLGGASLVVEGLMHIAARLVDSFGHGFQLLLEAESALGRLVVAVWLVVLGITLVRRAVLSRQQQPWQVNG